jgi:hypothetical protein
VEWAARAVGAFYVLAGLLVFRAVLPEISQDNILAIFRAGSPGRKENMRTAWVALIAVLTLASGGALLFLSMLATGFFIASAVAQGAFLLWTDWYLPAINPAEVRGRRSTFYALQLYIVALGFVVWLHSTGVLN